MIILILAVIGLILGVVFGLASCDDLMEVIAGAILLSLIGTMVGIILVFIADFIPFEEEEYLAYTTEMTDFEPIGKDGDRIIYQYTDRNGVSVEFKPSQRRVRVSMKYVNEDFRIETYKSKFTNKHADYLLPSVNKSKHHIIYRKGE